MNRKLNLTVDQYTQVCLALEDRAQELTRRTVAMKLQGRPELADQCEAMYRSCIEVLADLKGSVL